MVKLYIWCTFIFTLFALNISAEEMPESEKRDLEREIKTSGLYLYGEAVGKDKAEATKLAKSVLVSEINKEIVNNPEWQYAKTIKAENVEYGTDMIDLPRGNKVRVIAYLKKDDLSVVFSDSSPQIKISDKKEDKKKKEEPVEEEVIEEQPIEQEVILQEEIEEEIFFEDEEEEPVVVVVEDEEDEEDFDFEQDILVAADYDENMPELLRTILKAESVTAINKILRDNKYTGKAAYGSINTLKDSSIAYILVYKSNGDIVAILDKGKGTERLDLLSGEMKDTTELYKSNLRIWFQLF